MTSHAALKSAREAARALEWRLAVLADQMAKDEGASDAELANLAYEWHRNVEILLNQIQPEPNESDDSEVLAWTAS
jgi:hypothetical protein